MLASKPPREASTNSAAEPLNHVVFIRPSGCHFELDKVREDRYPSPTHLALIEKWISRDRLHDYLRVLIDKVEQDTFPSIPMLRASSAWPSACRAPNTGTHENGSTLELPPRRPSLEKRLRHPLQTHRTSTNAELSTAANTDQHTTTEIDQLPRTLAGTEPKRKRAGRGGLG
jgi:hypothetical protein